MGWFYFFPKLELCLTSPALFLLVLNLAFVLYLQWNGLPGHVTLWAATTACDRPTAVSQLTALCWP